MRKLYLRSDQTDTVAQSVFWMRELLQVYRAGSNTKQARALIAREYGLAAGTIWALLYRPPKSIAADVFLRLQAAIVDAKYKQLEKLEREIQIAQIASWADRDTVAKARAVADAAKADAGMAPDVAR